jgi:hypothetical protein
MLSSGNHFSDWVIFKFFSRFRLSLHPKEYHFILAHLLNLLSCKNTSNATLDVFGGCSLLFLGCSIVDLAFFDFLFMLER